MLHSGAMSSNLESIDEHRRWLRTVFQRIDRGASTVIDLDQRRSAITDWTRSVEAVEHIELTPHPGDRDARSATLCRFRFKSLVGDQGGDAYRDAEFRIDHDRGGHLFLRTGRTLDPGGQIEMPLHGDDQIVSLVDALLAKRSAEQAEVKRKHAGDQIRLQCIESNIRSVLPDGYKLSSSRQNDDAVMVIEHGGRRITFRRPIDDFAAAAAEVAAAAKLAMELSRTDFAVTIQSVSADQLINDKAARP